MCKGEEEMSEEHPKISEDRLFFFENQELIVNDFDAPGYILDIGGGGEGVIGKLKGEQVIAIDPNRRELEEAPAGPLKIVMDARDLQFLDGSFSTATSFFTLMYIKGPDHAKVLSEVCRVLKPGGRFFIWDVIFPPRVDSEKDVAVVSLLVRLPDEEITAGYGHLWPDEGRDLSHYVTSAENAGFNVLARWEENQVFFLELRKPEVAPSSPIDGWR
jgi:SAM-dependent methyltransferase